MWLFSGPAQFVERTILFPLNCPEILVENQLIDHRGEGVFLNSQFNFIDLYVCPVALPHSLGYVVL